MKIIVDAFGGDHAPLAVIEGCRQAVDELGAEILLTGDEEKIRQAAAEAKNLSSPSRGTWIEILLYRSGLLPAPVVPLAGDVD
mgnify:CR=1 FL=1